MRYIVFLVLIGFVVILSTNAYAMPPFNSQEIYDFSNVIAVGKVISVNSTFSPTHNLYEIKVEKFLKNQQDSDVLFAAGQKTANIRLGNQVFDVNDRGLFYLTNNTMGYDPYSGIFLVYPTSQLIEPEWDKCNIFDKEIPREHWVFGGTGQMPAVRQGNNTDIENFAIGKQVLISYDVFNHLPDAKNVTYGIMIKKLDEPDYLYTETNNSYLLEPCVPYKTLTWTFTPTKSGQYAVEIYDLAGSQMGVGFTAKSLPLCTSDRTACFQDEYTCDPAGWECADTENIFNTVIDSPLKQIKAGIALVDIKCNDEKYPAIRYDRMRVACVSLDTESKLVMRGWATMRLVMPGDNISEALCNNYGGKWHPEYDGCRDISDLQCSLIGGKFDDLKICENGICPDRSYKICVTENEKPEPAHTSEDEMKLIYAKQKLQEIYTLNSSFGSFTIKDAIVGYGIAGDSLVVDVLTEYYESDLDLIKQKIQDIVGSEITIIFSPSGAIVPTNIESVFPYVWNNFLYKNGIEFAPKEQTYSNHDDGFYDVDKVCSPLIASNGTEFYISSTFIYEPFEITGTFIDKAKPDDCHKVWKTDTIMVEPDRTLGLWLENYHKGN